MPYGKKILGNFHILSNFYQNFISYSLLKASECILSKILLFGERACSGLLNALKNRKSNFIKWTTFGEPPICIKKLSEPKIESQLRNTFGQSLISTLYVFNIQYSII